MSTSWNRELWQSWLPRNAQRGDWRPKSKHATTRVPDPDPLRQTDTQSHPPLARRHASLTSPPIGAPPRVPATFPLYRSHERLSSLLFSLPSRPPLPPPSDAPGPPASLPSPPPLAGRQAPPPPGSPQFPRIALRRRRPPIRAGWSPGPIASPSVRPSVSRVSPRLRPPPRPP
jgi:hypothetical protein